MKALFKLYDIYDMPNQAELLGRFDSMKEVRAAAKERGDDTDGEWCPLLYRYDEATDKYYPANFFTGHFEINA